MLLQHHSFLPPPASVTAAANPPSPAPTTTASTRSTMTVPFQWVPSEGFSPRLTSSALPGRGKGPLIYCGARRLAGVLLRPQTAMRPHTGSSPDRHRAMSTFLGDEGHMKWAEAMP